MAHKFTVQPVKKTAEQLRQEADELEQVAMQQARIDAVKKMQNDSKVGGIFDSLGQAKERAKQLFGNGQSANEVLPTDALNEDEEPHQGRTTDPLPADDESEDVFPDLPDASNTVSNTEYVTEEMPRVTRTGTTKRSAKKLTSHERTKQKIQRLLAKYPDATQSVIAQKANISRSYVSRISKELTTAQ